MKKIALISVLLLSSCGSGVDTDTWQDYENGYYDFSISYPENYSYCVNEFCLNEIPDDAIAYFGVKNELGQSILLIQPYTNYLSVPVTEFAETSLELNGKYSTSSIVYSDQETVDFHGEAAFSFLANGGVEERGSQVGVTSDGHIALGDIHFETSQSPFYLPFSGEFQVIYVGHGDKVFRILVENSAEARGLLDHFEFLEDVTI